MNIIYKKILHFYKEVYVITCEDVNYIIIGFDYKNDYSESLEFTLQSLDYPTKYKIFRIETEICIHNGYGNTKFRAKGNSRFYVDNLQVIVWDINQFAEIYIIYEKA